MDSSMTTYWHAGWPSRSSHPSHKKSPSSWEKMIPADLQPNGTDIIRTWDYYLMLRSLMLTKKPAYKSVLVNGMVLGEDGRKMSKSLGNYVTAKDALEKSSVDAIRYWTTRGSVGSDLPFSWKEVQHAEKFYNKIFNVFQFSKMHLKTRPIIKSVDELEIVDRWILTRLQKLTNSVTNHFENYQFNEAMNAIEVFVWHELADYYIEMAKHRLYGNDERNKRSAQFTLYTCLFKTIKLLAPFAPYITENVYQDFFRKFEKGNSIHMEKWPTSDQNLVNTEAEKLGELAVDVISAIRQFKTSRKMPMNAPLRLVTIEQEDLLPLMDDIKGTMKIEQIKTGRAEEILTEKFNIGLKIEV
jgi:valyl-tRNA synthetase